MPNMGLLSFLSISNCLIDLPELHIAHNDTVCHFAKLLIPKKQKYLPYCDTAARDPDSYAEYDHAPHRRSR